MNSRFAWRSTVLLMSCLALLSCGGGTNGDAPAPTVPDESVLNEPLLPYVAENVISSGLRNCFNILAAINGWRTVGDVTELLCSPAMVNEVITHLGGLEGFKNLERLELHSSFAIPFPDGWAAYDYFELQGIEVLQSLPKLYSISITRNEGIQSAEFAADCRYTEIDLGWTEIQDLAPLFSCKNRRKIGVARYPDVTIEDLAVMPELESIDISQTRITDFSKLTQFRNLRVLKISYIKPPPGKSHFVLGEDIPLMESLEELIAIQTPIGDLHRLPELPRLRRLEISSPGPDLPVRMLALNSELEVLDARGVEILEPELLPLLRNLQSLKIDRLHAAGGAKEKTGMLLRNLSGLKYLQVEDARDWKDVEPLSSLENLRMLTIRDAGIVDYTPIGKIESLRYFESDFFQAWKARTACEQIQAIKKMNKDLYIETNVRC